jgi:hypothetical protein
MRDPSDAVKDFLHQMGFQPTLKGRFVSVTLPNGVKLYVEKVPCFCPFTFLTLNIKKIFPEEIRDALYIYSGKEYIKVDEHNVQLVVDAYFPTHTLIWEKEYGQVL